MADDLAFLHDGIICENGGAAEVLQAPRHGATKDYVAQWRQLPGGHTLGAETKRGTRKNPWFMVYGEKYIKIWVKNMGEKYGFIWVYMGLYGFIWVYMGLYGFVWVYHGFIMGLYGLIMGLSWVYHGFIMG